MFVSLNSQVSVDDLIKGMIVQSGNDACIVLAEGLSGSEAAFAEEMTKKAHEMGAVHTQCVNATGWPDEGHLTTARDLALISSRTIHDFPEYYAQYYAIQDFTYNKIKQGNRNTLLTKGADGIKTGHTEAGGYGTVVSSKQGDRRLILVINGLPSASAREKEALALLNWGFAHFKNYKLFKRGDAVDTVDVWGGVENTVALVPAHDVVLTLPRDRRPHLRAKVIYNSPLAAPIKAGDEVGSLELTVSGQEIQKIPLYAAKSVKKANILQRIKNSLAYLVWGKHKS